MRARTGKLSGAATERGAGLWRPDIPARNDG